MNKMLLLDNVSKRYKLGQIGGTTLRDEIQRKRAKRKGLEDPTTKVNAKKINIGEDFYALSNISFEVKKGERVGIIGHNGAGKSTLLKLISRVTAPTEGTLYMNGRVASMLEVGTGFHPELTGRENIYMNGAILGMTKKEIDSKIEDIIDFSECRQFIDTPVKRYSSGMYVKLAFSVAAHLDSEIMIMDEVLAVGDMAFQKKCIDKMNDVSRQDGRTILYVSHNMNTIRQLCDRVIVLDYGQIVFDGEVEKGISIYLNYIGSEDSMIDYSTNSRLINSTKGMIDDVVAKYVNKDNNIFKINEKMNICFNWENIENIYLLSLRVELRMSDRSPIGTSFIYNFYSGKKNKSVNKIISVDISSLVPGNYASTYTFFTKCENGSNEDIFCAKGLNFRIVDDRFDIVWRKQWGNVKFPDVEVIK